jgi:hypothetical protein
MEKEDKMDDRKEKMGNGENVPALGVHQLAGEAQPFYMSNRGVETNMGE